VEIHWHNLTTFLGKADVQDLLLEVYFNPETQGGVVRTFGGGGGQFPLARREWRTGGPSFTRKVLGVFLKKEKKPTRRRGALNRFAVRLRYKGGRKPKGAGGMGGLAKNRLPASGALLPRNNAAAWASLPILACALDQNDGMFEIDLLGSHFAKSEKGSEYDC